MQRVRSSVRARHLPQSMLKARGAESLADFVHKLGIVRKELNETDIWFRIITKAELLPETKLTAVRDECVELTKIIAGSVATLRQKRNAK